MIDRDRDDLAQLRRRNAGDRDARDRARLRAPDANGVLLARVPADAIVSPGPTVIMCEPLDTIDAVEKPNGGLGLSWTSDDDGLSLVPIVVLNGVRKPGSVLLARPVAGRWVEEVGGPAPSGGCNGTIFPNVDLIAKFTYADGGIELGNGPAGRACKSTMREKTVRLRRIELPPWNPAGMNLKNPDGTPGTWPANEHLPLPWPQPAEAGLFVPLIRPTRFFYNPVYGDYVVTEVAHYFGYGSSNGIYYVSDNVLFDDPIQAPRPHECRDYPSNCVPYSASGYWRFVVCCVPPYGARLISFWSPAWMDGANMLQIPSTPDGLPSMDFRDSYNIVRGLYLSYSAVNDYPPVGVIIGSYFAYDYIIKNSCCYRGPNLPRACSDIGLSVQFGPGPISKRDRSQPRGITGDGWFEEILIYPEGEQPPPPPPSLTDVTVIVCGCRCGDDCCPVEGATVRFRVGTIDRTGTTGADGRVTFAFTDADVLGQVGNITLDLTPPAGLTRFVAVTRTVTGGFGRTITTSLDIATGYACIGAFTPVPRYFVYTGSIVDTYAFAVPNCGFTVLPDGTRRTVVRAESCGGFGTDVYDLTLNVSECGGAGDSWELKRTTSGGTVTTTSGGTWSLETAVLDLLTEGVTEWPCGLGGRAAPMMMAMPPGDGESMTAAQPEPTDATRARVESCPHREPFTPDDPACWCPRWRCKANRYDRAWMKPTSGVYVSDCVACIESGGQP